eukprot:g3408.t1
MDALFGPTYHSQVVQFLTHYSSPFLRFYVLVHKLLSPKYFKTAYVAASAAVKMLEHALRGVEKGIKGPNRMPVEVMGILIGRPSTDPQNLGALVVTDAFPLPVEGIETRVEAGNEALVHMVDICSSLELTRDERYMGWYHSHPFDVSKNPQYFFSSTDCQNQVVWQRAEDLGGNPFLGIVIDPLRSIAKGRPEMGSFRAFHPTYAQPVPMSPAGERVTAENKAEVQERWGPTWNRYYQLETQYFMSDLTSRMVKILAKNFTWISVLSVSLKNDSEYRQQLTNRINNLSKELEMTGNSGSATGPQGLRPRLGAPIFGTHSSSLSSDAIAKNSVGSETNLGKAREIAMAVGVEQCCSGLSQTCKEALFTSILARQAEKFGTKKK